MFLSVLSVEVFRHLWSHGPGQELWPPWQMAFTVHWVEWWQLPQPVLLSMGCQLQWHPYLLGQTWQAFSHGNWERVWTRSQLTLVVACMTEPFYSIYGIINTLTNMHWCCLIKGQSVPYILQSKAHACPHDQMQMTTENFSMGTPHYTLLNPPPLKVIMSQ